MELALTKVRLFTSAATVGRDFMRRMEYPGQACSRLFETRQRRSVFASSVTSQAVHALGELRGKIGAMGEAKEDQTDARGALHADHALLGELFVAQ